MKILLASFILLAALFVIQTSFLAHFSLWGFMPNFVAFAVIGWNILENPKSFNGVILASSAGFFTDMFSGGFIGLWVAILCLTAVAIKFIKTKYVRVSFFKP